MLMLIVGAIIGSIITLTIEMVIYVLIHDKKENYPTKEEWKIM